ncbi:unnamed protein product [Cylicostephanus goldi]|uniref:Uncharacterized protein n=1 Tax=Cylicostephanus goldi TaxID=71465 RepID=A0A3P6SRY0_CYLGO|nr:unnamed protein product [Cylicostephanus goldi]
MSSKPRPHEGCYVSISPQHFIVGHLLSNEMKSQDVTSMNLLPSALSIDSYTDTCAPMASYPTLPLQQLLPFNFLLNPSMLSSFLPPLPSQLTSASQSPFG